MKLYVYYFIFIHYSYILAVNIWVYFTKDLATILTGFTCDILSMSVLRYAPNIIHTHTTVVYVVSSTLIKKEAVIFHLNVHDALEGYAILFSCC